MILEQKGKRESPMELGCLTFSFPFWGYFANIPWAVSRRQVLLYFTLQRKSYFHLLVFLIIFEYLDKIL